MTYLEEIQKSMNKLGEEGYIFIGQNLIWGGTSMYHTVKHLPIEQRIEIPVFEDIQAGMSIGMTLEGMKICSVYPRWDFMLLAMNEIVNHADKIKLMSDGQFTLKGLIFRVAVGSVKPMFPGEQHCGDYTEALKLMCKDIRVVKLSKVEQIFPEYLKAMESDVPTVLVELPDLYNKNLIKDIEGSKDDVKSKEF